MKRLLCLFSFIHVHRCNILRQPIEISLAWRNIAKVFVENKQLSHVPIFHRKYILMCFIEIYHHLFCSIFLRFFRRVTGLIRSNIQTFSENSIYFDQIQLFSWKLYNISLTILLELQDTSFCLVWYQNFPQSRIFGCMQIELCSIHEASHTSPLVFSTIYTSVLYNVCFNKSHMLKYGMPFIYIAGVRKYQLPLSRIEPGSSGLEVQCSTDWAKGDLLQREA